MLAAAQSAPDIAAAQREGLPQSSQSSLLLLDDRLLSLDEKTRHQCMRISLSDPLMLPLPFQVVQATLAAQKYLCMMQQTLQFGLASDSKFHKASVL